MAFNPRSDVFSARSGVTLLELVVVMAIMGVLAGTAATLAMRSSGQDGGGGIDAEIAEVRHLAITSRKPIRRHIESDIGSIIVLAFPDGSVLSDSAIALSPLTTLRTANAIRR